MATVNLTGTEAKSWVCDFSGNALWDGNALLNFKDSSTETQGRRATRVVKQVIFSLLGNKLTNLSRLVGITGWHILLKILDFYIYVLLGNRVAYLGNLSIL
jgi:hypothetical protein